MKKDDDYAKHFWNHFKKWKTVQNSYFYNEQRKTHAVKEKVLPFTPRSDFRSQNSKHLHILTPEGGMTFEISWLSLGMML